MHDDQQSRLVTSTRGLNGVDHGEKWGRQESEKPRRKSPRTSNLRQLQRNYQNNSLKKKNGGRWQGSWSHWPFFHTFYQKVQRRIDLCVNESNFIDRQDAGLVVNVESMRRLGHVSGVFFNQDWLILNPWTISLQVVIAANEQKRARRSNGETHEQTGDGCL